MSNYLPIPLSTRTTTAKPSRAGSLADNKNPACSLSCNPATQHTRTQRWVDSQAGIPPASSPPSVIDGFSVRARSRSRSRAHHSGSKHSKTRKRSRSESKNKNNGEGDSEGEGIGNALARLVLGHRGGGRKKKNSSSASVRGESTYSAEASSAGGSRRSSRGSVARGSTYTLADGASASERVLRRRSGGETAARRQLLEGGGLEGFGGLEEFTDAAGAGVGVGGVDGGVALVAGPRGRVVRYASSGVVVYHRIEVLVAETL